MFESYELHLGKLSHKNLERSLVTENQRLRKSVDVGRFAYEDSDGLLVPNKKEKRISADVNLGGKRLESPNLSHKKLSADLHMTFQ